MFLPCNYSCGTVLGRIWVTVESLSPNFCLPKADFTKYGFSIICMKLTGKNDFSFSLNHVEEILTYEHMK